jgi:endonuclease/exonuclease/phosphatase family metal-dependent hydrolase
VTVEVRLLSYNVRSLRGDRDAVARGIRVARPGVVALQEAPRFLRWRGRRAALARDTGLVVVGGPRLGGVALLGALRTRVLVTRDALLSRTPGLHRRGVAMAVLEVAGARVALAAVHLGLDAQERRRHAVEALAHVTHLARPYAAPIVLGGDVNEEPGGETWAVLTARLRDGYAVAPAGPGATFPATQPRRRIDAVFVDPRIEVVAVCVPDPPEVAVASDHRPLLAVLRLPSPAAG